MSFLVFMLNTYEEESASPPAASGLGRRPNVRSNYLAGTGHGRRCRVHRRDGHETMPNFVGEWFPRRDVPALQDLYYASMLALLSPWRDIEHIVTGGTHLEAAFKCFQSETDKINIDIMDNLQYQYECSDSARKRREAFDSDRFGAQTEEMQAVIDLSDHLLQPHGDVEEPTSEDVESAIERGEFSTDDMLFAEIAMNIAFDAGAFSEEPVATTWREPCARADTTLMGQIPHLAKLVSAITKTHSKDRSNEIAPTLNGSNVGDVCDGLQVPETDLSLGPPPSPSELHANMNGKILNPEQKRAHDIVTNHLRAHLRGSAPRQTLVSVMGPGGTGKSTMLNAITNTFQSFGAPELLAKTAMSGVAASLIGGTTLHWFGGLPTQKIPQSDVWPNDSSKSLQDRRTANLKPPLWLAIDEIGMCTHDIFTLLSQVAGITRGDTPGADSTTPFGGLNMLLMGDFHQFPPVGASTSALYCTPQLRNTVSVGKNLYEQFETVINLTEQNHITDSVWSELLARARGKGPVQLHLPSLFLTHQAQRENALKMISKS